MTEGKGGHFNRSLTGPVIELRRNMAVSGWLDHEEFDFIAELREILGMQ